MMPSDHAIFIVYTKNEIKNKVVDFIKILFDI